MQAQQKSDYPYVLSYLDLRRWVGTIGIALPFVLIFGKLIFEGGGLLPSISAYYYSVMRDVFVGSLAAVAVVRALLNEDTEGLVVLLPDGLPEPGRELIVSLASLTVLSTKVAARAERITEGEYLDRLVRLWTDSPG